MLPSVSGSQWVNRPYTVDVSNVTLLLTLSLSDACRKMHVLQFFENKSVTSRPFMILVHTYGGLPPLFKIAIKHWEAERSSIQSTRVIQMTALLQQKGQPHRQTITALSSLLNLLEAVRATNFNSGQSRWPFCFKEFWWKYDEIKKGILVRLGLWEWMSREGAGIIRQE